MHKHNRQFISETQVYRWLAEGGVHTPKFGVMRRADDVKQLGFKPGDKVVVKGLADQLWHKSDHGVLAFPQYDAAAIAKLHEEFERKLTAEKFTYIETLVCERVAFREIQGMPTEGFVSLKWEESCGYVVRMGIGGIRTEFWAGKLHSPLLVWPVEMVSPEEAYEELAVHLLGQVWLGSLRQGEALTDREKILRFLHGIWRCVPTLEKHRAELIEMNPVVVSTAGEIVALDGVGEMGDAPCLASVGQQVRQQPTNALLNPKKVAIAGVSAQEGSFGRVIFENVLLSDIAKENIQVIKPNVETMQGIRCYPDITHLKADPVDVLILALPAALSCQIIGDLCAQGGGATVVYLVAGGIGDGADKEGFGKRIVSLIEERRAIGSYAPNLVGPNSLGIILSPLRLNTLFITPKRLGVKFHGDGNIGFVSQSGAFFITRLSKESQLPIKYGFCIGNQIDVRLSDFLATMGMDQSLRVIGVYAEGFARLDALKFARIARKLTSEGRHVILYKGGRSTEGMKAASGHTGAMASDHALHETLLSHAGVKIVESFGEFSAAMAFFSLYPDTREIKKIGAISNAGFETVGIADFLGTTGHTVGRTSPVVPFGETVAAQLTDAIRENKLEALVSVANPLDVTPMAGTRAYRDMIRIIAAGDVDAVVVGIVPLSEKLGAFDESETSGFAREIKQIATQSRKPVVMVIDSGELYDRYAQIFAEAGLLVFRSMDQALVVFK